MAQRIKREKKQISHRVERISQNKKPMRFYSHKQEKDVAESLNGKLTKNSGATMFDKGDLSTKQFLIECKTKASHSESISIKKDWITKNEQEALFMGKPYNAIAFNFGPGEENYYIINEYLFKMLTNEVEE